MPDDDTGSVRGRSGSSRFALVKEPLYQLDKGCNVTQGPYGLRTWREEGKSSNPTTKRYDFFVFRLVSIVIMPPELSRLPISFNK